MFKVFDGTALSDDEFNLTIDITPVNDAPTIDSISDQIINEEERFIFCFSGWLGKTLFHSDFLRKVPFTALATGKNPSQTLLQLSAFQQTRNP